MNIAHTRLREIFENVTFEVSAAESWRYFERRKYASEISCMSPYSMPLCVIFTKCPAPPSPAWNLADTKANPYEFWQELKVTNTQPLSCYPKHWFASRDSLRCDWCTVHVVFYFDIAPKAFEWHQNIHYIIIGINAYPIAARFACWWFCRNRLEYIFDEGPDN